VDFDAVDAKHAYDSRTGAYLDLRHGAVRRYEDYAAHGAHVLAVREMHVEPRRR
jgi:hypothetical protein